MKVSKYVKIHKDIMLEYIYDDGNLISSPYSIIVNSKTMQNSFASGDTSISKNKVSNTLFNIDVVTGKWGKVDTSEYLFLQTKDYVSGMPLRYDTIKVHLPINYTFNEFIGFHMKVYVYDYNMKQQVDISNFYFDMSDVNSMALLEYTNPPLRFQEKLWGKNIDILIPSAFALSSQRVNNVAKANSVNANLNSGLGISLTTPVFVEFSFIDEKSVINNVTTYKLGAKMDTSFPQTPEFENMGVKIDHSVNGDFFEIYGTFNNSLFDFKNFILNSIQLGHRYNVEYTITIYEQNIRGKSQTFYISENFNEKIEFRPIIKYSTTTAVIDVEMTLIDIVDNSRITRRASYGMLQDEVSKYSLRLMKINLDNAHKPKIYNIKNNMGAGIFTIKKEQGSGNMIQLEPIKVPFPVLIDKNNVVCKSDSVRVAKDTFWGIGKMRLMLYPFDNVLKLILASKIEDGKVDYLDLSSSGDVKLVFKSDRNSYEFPLFMETGEVNLGIGIIVFKIPVSKINDIRKIYNSGFNVFYITTSGNNLTTSVYSGVYKLWDNIDVIGETNAEQEANELQIVTDLETKQRETAIVTVRTIETSVIDPNSGGNNTDI